MKQITKAILEEIEESENTEDKTMVYMNTWKNYNEYGADLEAYRIKEGWMTPEEGLKFCEKYAEDEPFINDVENCPIEVSEYDNAPEKLKQLIQISEFEDPKLLKNALELGEPFDYTLEKIQDGDYIWFPGVESDYELGEAYVDMCGGIQCISDPQNYFNEDEFRDAIEYDEKLYYAGEHGIDPDDEDFPEDDFEQWLDDIVEDRASNPMNDDSYFDYAKLGDELGYDGYTFTTDGCICLL